MKLDDLKPAEGSIKKIKRVGRGQGSGMGKTSTRGGKGQTARSGYKAKRGFEGGQQPLYKRLPKVGFTSRVIKPYVINIEKFQVIANLDEITIESISTVHRIAPSVVKIKLIGINAKNLADKIKDSRVSYSGKI